MLLNRICQVSDIGFMNFVWNMKCSVSLIQILSCWCWKWNILGYVDQYHGCWCPGSLSPGHQQPWSCLCRINRSLSSKGKNFNYLTFHCSLRHQGRGDRDRCDPSERGVSGSAAGRTTGDAASPARDWLKISLPWMSCNNRACHPPWWPLLVLLSWCPVFMSSHRNSFKDQAPVDEIYGCLIFKWVTVTWLHDRVPG